MFTAKKKKKEKENETKSTGPQKGVSCTSPVQLSEI